MNYIDQVNVGGTAYAAGLPNIYINSKGNFNIETSAEIGNTSKGKINIESINDKPDVLDVTINSNTGTRGYLKVRAQAIDLRCEKHGGIAL